MPACQYVSAPKTHTHTHTLPLTGTAESHHFNLLEDCKLTSNSDRNGCQIVKQEKDEKRSFVKCLAFPSFTVWAQFWCRLTSAGPVWRHRDSPCGERVGGGFQSGSILTFCLLYLRLHTHTHSWSHSAHSGDFLHSHVKAAGICSICTITRVMSVGFFVQLISDVLRNLCVYLHIKLADWIHYFWTN